MSVGALLVVRFVKLAAVLALASGTLGAFAPRALEDRRRAAYLLGVPGFVVTWMSGLAMALGSGVSPVAAWIAGAVIASTVAMNVVLWAVAREGRRSWLAGTLASAGLAVALALMVWKPVAP